MKEFVQGHAVKAMYKSRRAKTVDGVDYRKLRSPKGGHEHTSEVLPAGSVRSEGALPLPTDIRVDWNVPVPLRDGTVILTDILRPVPTEAVPAIVAWSPYGKNRPMDSVAKLVEPLSGLQKFEAPDPAYWVARGYAVVNPDVRGIGFSGGDLPQWGSQDGRDGYDLVEWLAEQEWCSGRIGFAGNSYLAISQWFIGAERPPHLAAPAPWEGALDVYRHSIAPAASQPPSSTRWR